MADKDLSHWTSSPGLRGFLVASLDGHVVGTVAYSRQVEEEGRTAGVLFVFQDKTVEINRLSVDTKQRRLGVARGLVEEVERIAVDLGANTVIGKGSDCLLC